MKSIKEAFAAGLNAFQTSTEKVIRGPLLQMGFEQNPVIRGFIPDFAHMKAKVIVEIDGSVHDNPEVKRRDEVKDKVLSDDGWMVMRFTNAAVRAEFDYVVELIEKEVEFRKFMAGRKEFKGGKR